MRDAELLAMAHHFYGGLQFVEIPFLPRTAGKASGIKPRNLVANLQDLLVLAFSPVHRIKSRQFGRKSALDVTNQNPKAKPAKK
jgi:hypothetical protein